MEIVFGYWAQARTRRLTGCYGASKNDFAALKQKERHQAML